MGDFDNYVNRTQDAGVVAVVIGANKRVLEVELNEMQEVQRDLLKEYIRAEKGEGVYGYGAMTYNGGTFSWAADYAVLDGELLNNQGMSIAATEGDTIYIDMQEITATPSTPLKEYGNVQGNVITNYLIDPRINAETSRRKVRTFTLSKAIGVAGHKYLAIARIQSGAVVKLNQVVGYAMDATPTLATGTANTFAVSIPTYTAYGDQVVSVTFPSTSTGPSTININGAGAKEIRVVAGGVVSALTANHIVTGQSYMLKYAGGYMMLLNPSEVAESNVAHYMNGTGTFLAGQNTCTVTHGFITEATAVTVNAGRDNFGFWATESNDGNFVITSDRVEPENVTFDWYAIK